MAGKFLPAGLRSAGLGIIIVWAAGAAPIYRSEPVQPLSRFDAGQIALLEKLNRADRGHLARLPSLVVPEKWDLGELAYSPFPQFSPWAEGFEKALIVDQPGQAFAAYEWGHLVRWGPVSSGRQMYPTPSGLFHLNWRSKGRHSSIDPSWYMEWYFNFDAKRGLALHQYSLPGRPASHACIRLLERDAKWLYNWGEGWQLDEKGWNIERSGTPVLVMGRYDFNAPRPWLDPAWWETPIRLPEFPTD